MSHVLAHAEKLAEFQDADVVMKDDAKTWLRTTCNAARTSLREVRSIGENAGEGQPITCMRMGNDFMGKNFGQTLDTLGLSSIPYRRVLIPELRSEFRSTSPHRKGEFACPAESSFRIVPFIGDR
jgi:hypothetical protein